MNLDKYSDFERLQYFVRRKSLFPSASSKAFESVFMKYFKELSSLSNTLNIGDYKAAVNETFMILIDQIESGKVIKNLDTYIQVAFKRILRKIIDGNKIDISIDEYREFFIEMKTPKSNDALKYRNIDLMELLNNVLTNKNELEIMRLSALGYSLKEIASLLNITPNLISQIKERAISKLRNSIKK